MFNNVALDIFIGLIFIFLLYSLLATIIQEIIATQLSFRAKVLEKAILRMLEDGETTSGLFLLDRLKGYLEMIFRVNRLKNKKFASAFYSHPLIKYLAEDNWFSKPGYLSAKNFSKIIIELLHGINPNDPPINLSGITQAIANGKLYASYTNIATDTNNPANKALQEQKALKNETGGKEDINPETKLFLQSLLMEAEGDLEKFKLRLEQWYNDTMERASGWFKRYTQATLLIIGLVIAVGFNVDSIAIAKKLAKDPDLREQMVQNANAYVKQQEESGRELALLKIEGKDSLYRAAKPEYELLKARTDSLLHAADSLVNNEIKGVNEVMGLGYNCKHPRLMHIFFFRYPDVSFLSFIGWLITALAISLGAPFWFDLLSKLMKVRTATKIDESGRPSLSSTKKTTQITAEVQTQAGEQRPA